MELQDRHTLDNEGIPRHESSQDRDHEAAEVIVIHEDRDARPSRKRKRTTDTLFSNINNSSQRLQEAHLALVHERDQLQRKSCSLERENQKLQQLLGEQKARKILECPLCLESKEEWLSVKCGHQICYSCVLDLMTRKKFFKKACPLCRDPMLPVAVSYPNLR